MIIFNASSLKAISERMTADKLKEITLQGLALLPIFYAAVRFPTWLIFRPLNIGWVRFMGVLSYSLYLVHQVLDLGRPVIIALNMVDLAAAAGIRPHLAALDDLTARLQQARPQTLRVTLMPPLASRVVLPRLADFRAAHAEFIDCYLLLTNSTRGDLEAWCTGARQRFGIARPGKPRRLLSYIGGAGNYHRICDEVKASGYAGFQVA